MKTSSRFLLLRLFLLLLYTTHKEDFWLKTLHDAVIVVVVVIIMVATTISMCIYIYIYIYVCVCIFSFQLLLLLLPWSSWCVQVCYSLPLSSRSLSSFFSSYVFFRFDWRSKYWMLYAVSFLSLFLLSVTIHFSRVLLCLSYTAPSCSVSMRAIRIFCFKKKKKRIAKRIISTRLSYVEVEKREILVNSFVALTEHYRD